MEEVKKGLDLLALLDKELKEKNITDKKVIKDYLYQRCGQIFKVDPKGAFCTPEERKILNEQRIDIRNVTTFELNCYSWSYAFVDLLKSYMIPARVDILVHKNEKDPEKTKTHARVISYIGGDTFFQDLYGDYEDIYRTKFNFEPHHNIQLSNNCQHKNTYVNLKAKKDSMIIFVEKFIEKLEKLDHGPKNAYQIFKAIEIIINSDECQKKQLDYITGIRFISVLLLELSKRYELKHKYKNIHYYNMDEGIYIELYKITFNGRNAYFAYQEVENNNYKLFEVSEDYVIMLEESCTHIEGYASKKNRKLCRRPQFTNCNIKKAQ